MRYDIISRHAIGSWYRKSRNKPMRWGIWNAGLKLILAASVFPSFSNNALGKAPCDKLKMEEIMAEATNNVAGLPDNGRGVEIDCNLNLNRADVITKRLILKGPDASGVTVNCNFATLNGGPETLNHDNYTLEIRSTGAPEWKPPEDIVIKNCNIMGAVRVWGMAPAGEAEHLKSISRQAGYVQTVRNNAPRRILFENVKIKSHHTTPFYVAIGVTNVSLINSEVSGAAASVAIYLDAESLGNVIKGNYIHVVSGEREQLAIDGSSYNKIISNRFSALNNGGIFLYRNCGERGVTRHSTPSHNWIINNVFYYDKYTGNAPSVFLGSRDGAPRDRSWFGDVLSEIPGVEIGYCGDDSGSPYGSGVDDRDYARHNVVMQNQIYKRPIVDMIRTRNPSLNSPNFVGHNETVTVAVSRNAGCYVAGGLKTDFIRDGESTDLVSAGGNCRRISCRDGETSGTYLDCTKVGFDCQVKGNNAGCGKTVLCPSGKGIIGARAACNLEYGTIDQAELEAIPMNEIRVLRDSDNVSDGRCGVRDTRLQSGSKKLAGIYGLAGVRVWCQEHDSNGGDCHIKGTLYCR